MTFPVPNPGGWSPFDILFTAEMNIINDAVPFAIDGQSGGVYESAGVLEYRNAVIISGDGITPIDPTSSLVLEVIQPSLGSASDLIEAMEITGGSNSGTGDGGDGLHILAGGSSNAGFGGVAMVLDGGAGTGSAAGGVGAVIEGGGSFAAQTGGIGVVIEGGFSQTGVGGVGLHAIGGFTSAGSGSIAAGVAIIADGGIGSDNADGPAGIVATGGDTFGTNFVGGSGLQGGGGDATDVGTGGTGTVAFGGDGGSSGAGLVAVAGSRIGAVGGVAGPGVLGVGSLDDGTADDNQAGAGVTGIGGATTGASGSDFGGEGFVGQGGSGDSGANGGSGVFAVGGASDTGVPGLGGEFVGGLSDTVQAGDGLTATGGTATGSGRGGIGAIITGGVTSNKTFNSGVGAIFRNGAGGQVAARFEGVNETAGDNARAFIAVSGVIGQEDHISGIVQGSADSGDVLYVDGTQGQNALRLEANASSGDDGAHIYISDAVSAPTPLDDGMIWKQAGSIGGTPSTPLLSTLRMRIGSTTYRFVVAVS